MHAVIIPNFLRALDVLPLEGHTVYLNVPG